METPRRKRLQLWSVVGNADRGPVASLSTPGGDRSCALGHTRTARLAAAVGQTRPLTVGSTSGGSASWILLRELRTHDESPNHRGACASTTDPVASRFKAIPASPGWYPWYSRRVIPRNTDLRRGTGAARLSSRWKRPRTSAAVGPMAAFGRAMGSIRCSIRS